MAGGGTNFTLSSTGSTPALLFPQPHTVQHHLQYHVPTTIWSIISAGANLTYQIEASPDGTSWVALSNMTGLTQSKVNNLLGYIYALRLTVTAYSSGSVTLFANWSV